MLLDNFRSPIAGTSLQHTTKGQKRVYVRCTCGALNCLAAEWNKDVEPRPWHDAGKNGCEQREKDVLVADGALRVVVWWAVEIRLRTRPLSGAWPKR